MKKNRSPKYFARYDSFNFGTNFALYFDKKQDKYSLINSIRKQNLSRNVLVESARITRGNIKPLNLLKSEASNFEALIIPGGFGAAKNLYLK